MYTDVDIQETTKELGKMLANKSKDQLRSKYFLICFAKLLSISLCRGTGYFWPVAGFL